MRRLPAIERSRTTEVGVPSSLGCGGCRCSRFDSLTELLSRIRRGVGVTTSANASTTSLNFQNLRVQRGVPKSLGWLSENRFPSGSAKVAEVPHGRSSGFG